MNVFLIYYLISFNSIISLPIIENLIPFHLNTNTEISLEYKNSEIDGPSNIILMLNPYINDFMFGQLCIFTNINIINDYKCIDININEQSTFMFNEFQGDNSFFFKFKGQFNGMLTIFKSNQMNILNINYSYYFNNIQLPNELDNLIFKIPKSNIFKVLNIILDKDDCGSLTIFKDNSAIPCENNINNYLILDSNNEYILQYYPNIGQSLTLNFLDNIISDIDTNFGKNFISSNYFDFYFIMNVKDYKFNETFILL